MLVESTDVPPGMNYRQAAKKAVASCVSDFAAKGVRPDSFLVSMGLKRGTSRRQVRELTEGFNDAAKQWNLKLVGGDTNEARELVIDCAMFGYGNRIVRRDGAKPRDILVVTGAFGLQPAGLSILLGKAEARAPFRARATDSALNPRPNLALGIALAPHLSSSMDSSDGLARSLHTLASASGVGFELTGLPIAGGVKRFAKANGLSAEDLALAGGEEYVIVGTVPEKSLSTAKKAARRTRGSLRVIGRATNHLGEIVLVSKGSSVPIADKGWTHLG